MKPIVRRSLIAAALLVFHSSSAAAAPKAAEQCVYQTKGGEFRATASRDDVPYEYRNGARCRPAVENNVLARPDEIKLGGSERSELINSPLGEIHLRWPRKVESLFGRTPLRAMVDAANTVSRALKNNALPSQLQSLNLTWNVVFMDASLPEGQIPTSLVTNCHPGWMTPPANIYIVAQRVAGGCGSARSSTSVADATLTQVLVHEMGHATEFYLLNGKGVQERMRAEGFATWFEGYAAQYSSILSQRDITRSHYQAAQRSFALHPAGFNFEGTYEDYARASMYFTAATGPRGLQGLVDVYKVIMATNLDLVSAIKKALSWDDRRLDREIQDAMKHG